MSSNILDFNRLFLVAKRSFIERKKTILFEMLSIVAVFVAALGICAYKGAISVGAQNFIYLALLVIGGLIVADKAFSETKDNLRGMFYLMNPSSRLEKLISAVFTTSVVFPVVYTLLFMVIRGIFYLIFDVAGIVQVDPFSVSILWKNDAIRPLLIFQSVFILGSIWFKRNSFLKTSVSIVGFFVLISAIASWIILANILPEVKEAQDSMMYNASSSSHNGGSLIGNSPIFESIMEVALWLLAPFFWLVAYFRLSEKQI